MARDLYQQVTDRIVAALEAGTAPWAQPFSQRRGHGLPCNAISNRPYSGVNVLLFFTSMANNYPTNRFLTFKQAKEVGGWVKKGEKAHALYFFKKLPPKDGDTDENGKPKKGGAILREYYVFNVDQCENLPDHVRLGRHSDVLFKNEDERNAEADEFIKSWGAKTKEGPQPMYVPSKDFIFMPPFADFKSNTGFYATAFHEGAHWTGHKSRLDRNLKNRFGTAEYAMEELVAELAASFLCAEFGFDVIDNSASYLKSWLEVLKADKRAIFTAASAAQKAADFLRGKALEEVPGEETISEAA